MSLPSNVLGAIVIQISKPEITEIAKFSAPNRLCFERAWTLYWVGLLALN